MRFSLFGKKATPPTSTSTPSGRGWYPLIHEPYAGAWQQNVAGRTTDVLAYSAVYACVTLIAQDISKLRIKLVEQDEDGIWSEVDNPAYSPVLRKPNHYQTRIDLLMSWTLSKLIHGNAYLLKERDARGVVVALYVLDPTRVRVLVAADGSVYYGLGVDNLSQIADAVTIPASEIIHDKAATLYHPLVGISPISACALAAMQGLAIQGASAKIFAKGAMPGGLLFVPPVEFPSEESRQNLQRRWEEGFAGANAGRVAVLATDWRFEHVGLKASDAQLIEQLKWTADDVCMAFHVPPYKIGAAAPPPYNNIEALTVEYYAQALQQPIESIELLLDEGLGMAPKLGTELDIENLLRMDTQSRAIAAEHATKSGMSPNEVRARFYDLGPVEGGEVPYLQEQNWPISVLAARPTPTRPPTPPAPTTPPVVEDEAPVEDDDAAVERVFAAAFRRAWDRAA